MRTSSRELKARAKRVLAGKYGTCAGACLIMLAIVFAMFFILIIGFEISILGTMTIGGSGFSMGVGLIAGFIVIYLLIISIFCLLEVGYCRLMFNISLGKEYGIGNLFFAFGHHPFKYIGLFLLLMLIVLVPGIPYIVVFAAGFVTDFMPMMLWLLFLMYLVWLVGSVVITLRFGMALFIMVDEPGTRIIDSLRLSADMLRGHKGRLFYLYLSFFGMILLGYLSFGIGLIWIIPYMNCTLVQFYLERRENLILPTYMSYDEMQNPTW